MENAFARHLAKDLNILEKRCRVEVEKEMVDNVAADPVFSKRINTGDETWVYEYDLETAAS